MAETHNVELEQNILGILLVNNDMFDQCDLEPTHFYDPVHARIFQCIKNRVESGRLASPVTVRSDISGDEGIAALGGPKYLTRLVDSAFNISGLAQLARDLKSLAYRRALAGIGEHLAKSAGDMEKTPQQVADEAEEGLAEAGASSSQKPMVQTFAVGLLGAMQDIHDAYHTGSGVTGTPTGLTSLDKATGGFGAGDQVVIAGRPSMGKTALAFSIAASMAMQGQGVIYASFEMPQKQLSMRFLSMMMRRRHNAIAYSDLRKGRMAEQDARTLSEEVQKHASVPLLTIERDCNTLGRLGAAVRRGAKVLAASGKPLGAIFVDHIGLMSVPGSRSKIDEVTAITGSLKRMAMEMDAPVIALSQLNRAVELRDNKRPTLADLRDSGSVEQDADTVIFCYRDAYYLQREAAAQSDKLKRAELLADAAAREHDLEMIIAKQRAGQIGTALAHCEIEHNFITDKGANPDQGALM